MSLRTRIAAELNVVCMFLGQDINIAIEKRVFKRYAIVVIAAAAGLQFSSRPANRSFSVDRTELNKSR